jgi:hypothetical protein
VRTLWLVVGSLLAAYALLMFDTSRDPLISAVIAVGLVAAAWPWEGRSSSSRGRRR